MILKLNSNRKWIFRILVSGVLINLVTIIPILIMIIVDFEETLKIGIPVVLFFVVFPIQCIYIIVLLVAKYKKGMSYIFYADRIEVYKRDIFQYAIDASDIATMNYYPFKFQYILTIYAGALSEGGAWKIHITTKNQVKHSIGYISQHDARKIKEMYPRLMKIMFDKKDKTIND